MSIADHLRTARQRVGLTQAEAAALCEVSLRTYEGWERNLGKRSIGPRDALAVLRGSAARTVPAGDGNSRRAPE